MSVSIIEVLQNAQFNIESSCRPVSGHFQYKMGMEQLKNAITALENGHNPNDEFNEETFKNEVA